MKIRLTQIDGKYPNLALMKLSAYYKCIGAYVHFERSIAKGLFDPEYDFVFGSAIFTTSLSKVEKFFQNFPHAVVGGSVWDTVEQDKDQRVVSDRLRKKYGKQCLRLKDTVDDVLGIESYEFYDYSIYPSVDYALGFMSRGCTQSCSHCGVPRKEGKIRSAALLEHLLSQNPKNKNRFLAHDNDALNAPNWGENFDFLVKNNTKICYSQGINARLIDARVAKDIARTNYRNDDFSKKMLHTAFDDIADHDVFFKGINHLLDAGVKPRNITVYMLCNYDESKYQREIGGDEIPTDVWYRFNEMVKIGLLPFPMIYHKWNASPKLKKFQQWVITGAYHATPFEKFLSETKREYFLNKDGITPANSSSPLFPM